MTDVRVLQILLDGGVTDPRALMAAMPTGTAEDVQRAVEVLSPMAFQPAPFEIPDDGREHACPCGSSGYRTWDGDGWALAAYGRLLVTDDEGRTVESCHGCDRELVAVAVKPKRGDGDV